MSVRLPTVTAVCLTLACGMSAALAEGEGVGTPPLMLPTKDVSFRIVGATFVTKVTGTNARFDETQTDKFRGLILTVEVKKPAGSELTVVAQDFNLHYHYGEKSDVSRCQGLSTFSTQMDVDRAMNLFNNGIGRSTTGLSTTKGDTLFLDMFFQFMEPDTSDLHLFIAQPAGTSFKTTGWK